MKKAIKMILVIFLLGTLTACQEDKNIETSTVEKEKIGPKNEKERTEMINEIKEPKSLSGYLNNENEMYYANPFFDRAFPIEIPGVAIAETVVTGTEYTDKEAHRTKNFIVDEYLVFIKDWNTQEIIREVDLTKTLKNLEDYHLIPMAYSLALKDNQLQLVLRIGKDGVDLHDGKEYLSSIRALFINLDTKEMTIEPWEREYDVKYKENLGYFNVTDFQDINTEQNVNFLNRVYVQGYNYYWKGSKAENLCQVNFDTRYFKDVEDREFIEKKLIERFPELVNILNSDVEYDITLYLNTDEADLLALFGTKDSYTYEGVTMSDEKSGFGKEEKIANRDDIQKKIDKKFLIGKGSVEESNSKLNDYYVDASNQISDSIIKAISYGEFDEDEKIAEYQMSIINRLFSTDTLVTEENEKTIDLKEGMYNPDVLSLLNAWRNEGIEAFVPSEKAEWLKAQTVLTNDKNCKKLLYGNFILGKDMSVEEFLNAVVKIDAVYNNELSRRDDAHHDSSIITDFNAKAN